uniref:hypothetical protein n=1 Tax=Enterocloster aldenensis TaxID=358742 RepID=UPI0029CAA7E6
MKRSEKSRKASRVDANKAKQADFDRAIRERIRTAPAYMYTSLWPDPGRRRPPKGVIQYYDPSRKTPLGASEQKAAYIQSFQ